jgi:ABC-2 type transport system permease protein
MRRVWVVCRHALGQLLTGRRLVVIVLLSAVPLLLPALLFAAQGDDIDPADFSLGLFRGLVLPVLLPVVSLAFSTFALGAEVRDGTATNLLLKPIPRAAILGAEYLAAVLATLLVLLPLVIVSQVIAGSAGSSSSLLVGSLAATAVGALVYGALGLLLSLFIGRALLVGLVYTVLWEGALVSVAPSASSLAVRGYAEGVLAAVTAQDGPPVPARLGPLSATILAAAVTLLALVFAARRLARMDIR